jgi:invasion protein IalB
MRTIMAAAAAVVFTVLALGPAQAASSLPGGASTLREVYEDWVLNCRVAAGAEGRQATVTCGISQELFRQQQQQRQRVAALALTPDGSGTKGTLLMPFGLALAAGVRLQIDEGPQTAPIAFRTCTPQGCIIPIEWPESTINGLRNGVLLKIAATSDNGQPVNFSISLKGFAAGLSRAIDLLK